MLDLHRRVVTTEDARVCVRFTRPLPETDDFAAVTDDEVLVVGVDVTRQARKAVFDVVRVVIQAASQMFAPAR